MGYRCKKATISGIMMKFKHANELNVATLHCHIDVKKERHKPCAFQNSK